MTARRTLAATAALLVPALLGPAATPTAATSTADTSTPTGGSAAAAPAARVHPAADTTLTPIGRPFARASYASRFFTFSTDDQWSAAAVGDVTGEGAPDIVVGGLDGIVRVWNQYGQLTASVDTGPGAIYSTPALGDVSGDGVADVTVGNINNVIATFSFRGGQVATVLHRQEPAAVVPGPTGMFATPALADLDGDGRLDVIAASWGQTLHAITARPGPQGAHLPGWPKWLLDTIWSSPALGDIDADGAVDVVVGGDCEGSGPIQPCHPVGGGYVWAFDHLGREKWKSFVRGQVVWSSPALVDLNDDGALDVVVGTGLYWPEPAGDTLLAFDGRTGRQLWAAPTPEQVVGSPSVADVDGDGRPELFAVSRGAHLLAFRSDGSRMWDRCIAADGRCYPGKATHGGAALADVDGDGAIEAITQGESTMRVWDARTGRLEREALSPSPMNVFAPPAPPTVAQVAGEAWVVQTALGDGNGNLRHDRGDELLVMVWRTGAPLGAAPWPTFKGRSDRRSVFPLRPLDPATHREFVAQLYADFLGRAAGPTELDGWTADLVARRRSRADVAAVLASSDEWIGSIVRRYYRDTLGRAPDPGGLAGWSAAMRGGMPAAQVAAAFYASEEYYRGAGGGSDGTWVTDLYRTLLGRAPDAAGLAGWVGALRNGMHRDELAAGLYQSPESLRTRIDVLYRDLLGRPAEPGGITSWSPLVRDAGDLVLAAALATSEEYFARAQTP